MRHTAISRYARLRRDRPRHCRRRARLGDGRLAVRGRPRDAGVCAAEPARPLEAVARLCGRSAVSFVVGR